ncbi:MAG: hypothetical protein LDL41_23400, partial [Coleofasciculus sp. S288]|nr:hypothetical protein [Coleofasciculus sp. S288]
LAPLLPTPEGGVAATVSWDVFSRWDSSQYKQIVTSGYEYIDDSKGYNIVFFPLFPVVIRAVMALGLPFEVAGTLVNNLAFLGALIVLYLWVEERHSRGAARWATAALAWCPFSLFGTVIYTEGLFLLLSTAALRAFDKQQYLWVAIWGALATATRPTGMTIIPAFLIVAWKERRPAIAYFASLAAGTGLLLYTLYCGIQFGNPLAFILNQRGWQPQQAFHGQGWLKMLVQISAGSANWKSGSIIDPWHPLLFILICGCGYLLWRFQTRLGSVETGYGVCFLIVLLWLLAGAPLINAVMVFGGAYLLWHLRAKLRPIVVAYGFCSLAFILSTGRTSSAERYAYGTVSLAIALGVLLARYPRWGYATMGFFTLLLASLSVRFAQHLWAG